MRFSPTRNSIDFCYFPWKFGTHLERERIDLHQNFFNVDIVLKLTTGVQKLLNVFNCRMPLTI